MERALRTEMRDYQPSTGLDVLALRLFGRSKVQAHAHRICVRCGEPPVFSTDAGQREYRISGLCEPCFDLVMGECESGW